MKLSKRDLKLVGLSLYKCEGTRLRIAGGEKKIHSIEFTNKEPAVIQLFIKFLREILRAEEKRIKGELFIYEGMDKVGLEKYWSKTSGIPLSRFNKTIVLKQKNPKYKPNPLGTFKIRYHHKNHFLRLNRWINSLF